MNARLIHCPPQTPTPAAAHARQEGPSALFRHLADETLHNGFQTTPISSAKEMVRKFAATWNQYDMIVLDDTTVDRAISRSETVHFENQAYGEIPDFYDAIAAVITRCVACSSLIFCARLLALPLTPNETVRPAIFWCGIALFVLLTLTLIMIDWRARRFAEAKSRRLYAIQNARYQRLVFETALGQCRFAVGL